MCTHMGIVQDGRVLREGPVGAILSSWKGARTVRIGVVGDLDHAAAVLARQHGVSNVATVDGTLEASFAGDDRGGVER